MSGFNNPLTGLNGSLIYPQVKSPNFDLATETGWAILKNGDAYFFNVTATGTITATSVVVQGASGGLFIYAGVPANGNLIGSWTGASGTDAFGNSYAQGAQWGAVGSVEKIVLGITGGSPLMYFLSAIGTALNNAAIQLNVSGAGTAAYDTLVLKSSEDTAHVDYVAVNLVGNSNDGVSQNTEITLAYVDTGLVAHNYLIVNSGGLNLPAGVSVTGTETINEPTAATYALNVQVAGDAFPRFSVRADGYTKWGSGAVAADTAIERSAAGVLSVLANLLATGTLGVTGVLTATGGTAASPSQVATDTWHAVTPAAGWTQGVAPNPKLSYKLLTEKNCVWITGSMTYAGTPAGGTAMFTLPVGYRPISIYIADGYNTGASALTGIEINTTGAVTLFAAAALNPNVFVDIMIPLDL